MHPEHCGNKKPAEMDAGFGFFKETNEVALSVVDMEGLQRKNFGSQQLHRAGGTLDLSPVLICWQQGTEPTVK